MSHSRMTTLPFLLLVLSPFLIFDSDYALISCPLCKLNTIWNTLNPLGFSPLWFEPCSGYMWESQVLLTDGQVVFSPGSLVFAHL